MDKGAHFHRCDLQVHTPRDLNWQGASATSDAERQAYSDEFIRACRQKGLDGVAMTDHHDLAFVSFLRAAALAETDAEGKPLDAHHRFVVFPGMELTLGVPCQALLLLDADFPEDRFASVCAALSITPAPKESEKHAPIQRLGHIQNLESLCEILDQRDFLRGRYIVLPNVSEGGGDTILRQGFATYYKNMPCVGGYLDGPVSQHGAGNTGIVAGRNKDYGNKAIGLFQTSDNRRRDFGDLGAHTTWIKWAEPTAEALRQACLARESRLSQTVPEKPHVVVTALHVSNSQFMGPITLEFNPQYNAIIGGRGTGKSTLLEYLRWGLCDEPIVDDESELAEVHRKRHNLVTKTLVPNSAVVEVTFLINDIPHVVRRRAATGEVLLKIGNEEFKACSEADVRTLLPIHAYSQKQLSSVGVRLDELNRFVHAPIDRMLAVVNERIEGVKSRLRTAYEDVRRLRTLTAEIAKNDLERTSLGTQLDHLRKGLKGLSEADRKLIDEQSLSDQEQQIIEGWDSDLKETGGALQGLLQDMREMPGPLPEGESPNRVLLSRMHESLAGALSELREAIARLLGRIDPAQPASSLTGYATALAEWREKRKASLNAYAEAKLRSQAQEATLQQIKQVEDRARTLETQTADKRRVAQKLGDPVAQFNTLRAERMDMSRQRATLVEEQCATLTALSKGLIRARLRRGHRVDAVDLLLRSALKGSKVRAERYDAIWQHVRGAGDPYGEWNGILDELESLAVTTVDDEARAALPSTPTLDSLGFSTRDRIAVTRTMSPETWIALLMEELGDLPEFEYRVRESEFIRFSDASAGQQATALMFALLNQAGPPLVIDQPEDDLDNKVMEEVVREIWAAKRHRQLVFTSHNANLVVNGDAELVVCCDYRVAGDQSGGKIKLEGAIDMPAVNAEITLVMEGGREAFASRRAKYGF